MIDRRVHTIQIEEAHKGDGVNINLNIHFENEHRLFKPAKVHIPIRLVKYEDQKPIPEPAQEVTCPKCTIL